MQSSESGPAHNAPDPDLRQSTDEELQRWAAADERALEILYERYARGFEKYLRWRLFHDDECVREALSEAFLALRKKIPEWDPKRAGFLTWACNTFLQTIAGNMWRKAKRQREREVPIYRLNRETGEWETDAPAAAPATSQSGSPQAGLHSPDPATIVQTDEVLDTVKECLSELPSRERSVFIRVCYNGHRHGDVAQALGLPSKEASRSALYRARLKLKECLKRNGYSLDDCLDGLTRTDRRTM